MAQRHTRVLPITSINPPHVDSETSPLDWWNANKDRLPQDQVNHLLEAAHALQTSSIPVAFPTETVYGLGADATRSDAVRGIYAAKQRPSDNPLIVHVGSLDQLRALLRPPEQNGSLDRHANGTAKEPDSHNDPIPSIYIPLIQRFWPGPLTLLFPLPFPSPFASEVHPSLTTFGIRMPSSPSARLLISLSGRPLAAPSANASTRPSPTSAAHVLHDLEGRIEVILDGGRCEVGVESTVVDGMGAVPAILRPGGVGIEEIRRVGGLWENTVVGYRDVHQGPVHGAMNADGDEDSIGNDHGSGNEPKNQTDTEATVQMNGDVFRGPRAPGMKYRHYAPRARVHLFEPHGKQSSSSSEEEARAKVISYRNDARLSPARHATGGFKIGVIATQTWRAGLGFAPSSSAAAALETPSHLTNGALGSHDQPPSNPEVLSFDIPEMDRPHRIYSVSLGPDVEDVARGLFSTLRALDGKGCDVILIEGIGDTGGGRDLAAAVMDRLRKAADG